MYLTGSDGKYAATKAHAIPKLKHEESVCVEVDDLYNGKGIMTK